MADQITIAVPWKRGVGYIDWALELLDHTAELVECAHVHSEHEWVEWAIWDRYNDKIACGTTPDIDTAKTVVTDLIRDRWNATAAA